MANETKLYISKVVIGSKTYYLKDSEARAIIASLGSAAYKNVAEGVTSDEQGLVTGAQVAAAIEGLSGAMHFVGVSTTDPKGATGATVGTYSKWAAGDVVLWNSKEYVLKSASNVAANWIELGDESSYALKTVTIGTQNLASNISLTTLATDMGLGALSKKDKASGTVSLTDYANGINGASYTPAGTVAVTLQQTSTAVSSTGNFTPEGTVAGTVTPDGTVATQITNTSTAATLTTSDYTPVGTVSVVANTTSVKPVGTVGTAASFTEGAFTPASLTKTESAFAKTGITASVDDTSETLTFGTAATGNASLVTAFSGGSKAADTFTPNVPTSAGTAVTVANGIKSASFSGTKETGLKVTGVNYEKATGATSTFTGTESDIEATFAGTSGAVSVSGNYDKASVKTATFAGTDATITPTLKTGTKTVNVEVQ